MKKYLFSLALCLLIYSHNTFAGFCGPQGFEFTPQASAISSPTDAVLCLHFIDRQSFVVYTEGRFGSNGTGRLLGYGYRGLPHYVRPNENESFNIDWYSINGNGEQIRLKGNLLGSLLLPEVETSWNPYDASARKKVPNTIVMLYPYPILWQTKSTPSAYVSTLPPVQRCGDFLTSYALQGNPSHIRCAIQYHEDRNRISAWYGTGAWGSRYQNIGVASFGVFSTSYRSTDIGCSSGEICGSTSADGLNMDAIRGTSDQVIGYRVTGQWNETWLKP